MPLYRGKHYLYATPAEARAAESAESDENPVPCPLWRARRRGKLRAHRDTWLRREQHLFDSNEITLRDKDLPR